MNEIQKLNEEFNKLFSINEMSMAWEAQLKGRNSVCAWVEGPLKVDNQYIKYYNNAYYTDATKVARIRIDKPEYVGGVHSESGKKKWVLTEAEKRIFVQILQEPSKTNSEYTNWQQILLTYNRDNFHIYEPITGEVSVYKNRKSPSMPEHLLPFPIDYPMPDYTKLGE